MASGFTTRHIAVTSSTPTSRSFNNSSLNSERILQTNAIDYSHQTNINKEQMNSTTTAGVPVKFADNLFSVLIKDQISRLLNLPQIKGLKYTDENAARTVTYEITEILKRIVAQHIKDNYKVVIQVQVMTYPKQDEQSILIMSRCLWNYRTDDVLSLEIETDTFKFLIVIHGVAA